MPSCAPASISDRFCPARITVTALRLPCSARASSRSRRAEISANSAPTKNAFASSSRTVSSDAEEVSHQSPPESPWRRPSLTRSSRSMRRPSIRATVARHRIGSSRVPVRLECLELHRLSDLGDVAELLHHQPADGLVFALVTAESGGRGHLVDAQQPRHPPAVAPHETHRASARRVRRGCRRRSPRSGPRRSPCPRCRRIRRRPARSAGRWPESAPSASRRPGSTAPPPPGCATSASLVRAKSSCGSSKTCLTWTRPIVSSRSPSVTGKRE